MNSEETNSFMERTLPAMVAKILKPDPCSFSSQDRSNRGILNLPSPAFRAFSRWQHASQKCREAEKTEKSDDVGHGGQNDR